MRTMRRASRWRCGANIRLVCGGVLLLTLATSCGSHQSNPTGLCHIFGTRCPGTPAPSPTPAATTQIGTTVSVATAPYAGRWIPINSANPAKVPASDLEVRDVTGRLKVYVLPNIGPTGISWRTYRDTVDRFSVSYPSNWIAVRARHLGHEHLTVYPPGTNSQSNVPGGAPGIGIGWTNQYRQPSANDPLIAGRHVVRVGGVSGYAYTVGGLGLQTIAAFPHGGGSVVLGGDAVTDELIYVFQHMLASLRFR